ncbi:hypothetical protein OOJ91_12145 [Micromonospora lupini]|uniref:hypothetical protein n=1 Tax=Micromonospora lupini TaxID=285679 RepID=UPI00225C0426|nr:hypothetical protein [Micromonospora lupini]MCX5066629.1 hypothetical protein [Micromonospora lupini]
MISNPGSTPATVNTLSPALLEPTRRGPDWVLYGERLADGQAAVFASTELTGAELRYERDMLFPVDSLYAPERDKTRIYLTVQMKAYVMVVADTYQQAMRSLFDEWSPDGDQLALPAAPDGGPAR